MHTNVNKVLKYSTGLIIGFILGVITTYILTEQYAIDQARATLYLALKAYEQDRYDLSAALLNRYIAKDPDNYSSLALLGDIYAERGNTELALQMYSKSLELMEQKHIKNLDLENTKKKIDEIMKKGT